MSRQLGWYVALVAAAGIAVIATSVWALPGTPRTTEWLLLASAGVLAGAYGLKIPGVDVRISVSDTFFLALAVLFGPAAATVGTAIDCAATSWRRQYGTGRLLFNATGPPLSLWAAAHVFFFVAGVQPLTVLDVSIGRLILALSCMSAVWFLLNSGLTAIAVSLESNKPVIQVWQRIAVLGVNYAAAASASLCMVILTRFAGITAAAALLPLVFIFHMTIRSWLGRLDDAQQHVAKVDRLYLSTIETLATAIEAKDGVTHDHIRRVQTYAIALARALGVGDEATIKAIEAASLLHDTGKLAVPEHILNKPGKLSVAEFETMKLHVDAGADILSSIEFPYPVVPIVRCHHENWDGSGYPRGVKGTDIPIGARILSVVDCFDALTSDRPYRRALSDAEAIEILQARRGTMYDPLVVDTFLRLLPEMGREVAEAPQHSAALMQISRAASTPSTMAPLQKADTPDDLLALVSLARVFSGQASFEDALSLVTMHVRVLAPEATWALYMHDTGNEQLVVRYATGPLAASLRQTSMPVGQRLTGWVAANRQTIVNSDAALDLACLDVPGGARTCLSTPLLEGETVAGVLTLYSEPGARFDDEQGRLLQMIAPQVTQILARVQASEGAVRSAAAPATPARVVSIAAGRDARTATG
jgi:putative nucleotidyltransferase with HDIG domain